MDPAAPPTCDGVEAHTAVRRPGGIRSRARQIVRARAALQLILDPLDAQARLTVLTTCLTDARQDVRDRQRRAAAQTSTG